MTTFSLIKLGKGMATFGLRSQYVASESCSIEYISGHYKVVTDRTMWIPANNVAYAVEAPAAPALKKVA